MLPLRDFAIKAPVNPVSAIHGTRMNKPGQTIRLFTSAMTSNEPKASTLAVVIKKIAMHRNEINAVSR